MGTWIGHVAPGVFFIFISTWWAIITSYRYLKSVSHKYLQDENERGFRYKGSITMPCSCCSFKILRNLPIESIIKFTALFTQITGEFIMGSGYFGDNSNEKHFGFHEESLHHIIMFSGFLLAAFIEILVFYGFSLPKKSVYIINLVSTIIFISTIVLHLDGRDMIDYHLHKLFAVAAVMLTVVYCFEIYNPNNYWATYGRAYFFFIIGTWLIQIAFIMWPMNETKLFTWNPMSRRDMSLITFSFGVHLFAAAIYFTFLYFVVFKLFYLIDRCYGKHYFNEENEEIIKKFYYDYENINGLKCNKYDMILNDIDETDKLCQNTSFLDT